MMRRRDFIKQTAYASGLVFVGMPNLHFVPGQVRTRNVYIFSKHLQWLDFSEMAKVAKNLGFDGVDLTVRPGGHVGPQDVEEQLPKAIKAIRAEGLIIDTITTAITDASDKYSERIIKTASHLGVEQLRLGWYHFEEHLGLEENLIQIGEKLSALDQLCGIYNIRADYQNHSGNGFGASVWDIREVYNSINPKWLGVRYDVRHASVEGFNSWSTDLKAICKYVKSLDLKDFVWETTKQGPDIEDVPLGKGDVDFKTYSKLLETLEIPGNITLHLEYPLGGAEHGDKKLAIEPKLVLKAITRDLKFIKRNVSLKLVDSN
ncbi:sugar phosphate isomerase/epimerase [Flagellimonas sp. CMM7]|uniref:sugar phosphate isomerase/epimerase family protein n=1 Tax=Flagellimonas sp. CMM7 TaxID=2654676 RepID=UPI0013D28B63|nr:TIM barrel protein [Flagellimonas sp. CMM7]UII79856.1 sugar phosphate isomerase/epimerase [Flagellimonas sp. CMM7]